LGVPEGYKQRGHVWAWLEKALVGTVWAVSLLPCMIGLRKQPSHLVVAARLTLTIFHSLDWQLLAESADY